MNLSKIRFGRIVARLPENTLLQHTAPPFEYVLIPGGFLNSVVPGDKKILRYNVDEAEDGSALAHLDEEKNQYPPKGGKSYTLTPSRRPRAEREGEIND